MDAKPICEEVRKITNGPAVKVTTGTAIEPHLETKLHLVPELSEKAQHAFLFKHSKTGLLVSLDQLCDDDYIAIFAK